MPKRIAALLLVVVIGVAGACAGRANAGEPLASREVLTREQMEQVRATDAFDAVQRLRSSWLRPRGATMSALTGRAQFRGNQVVVYLDGQKLGGLENLRNIEVAAVQYIRHFSAAQASSRWGVNHGAGAIYVSTRPLER